MPWTAPERTDCKRTGAPSEQCNGRGETRLGMKRGLTPCEVGEHDWKTKTKARGFRKTGLPAILSAAAFT